MLPKFKNENLTAIVIILLLTMQFVLTMSGHRQIQTDVLKVQAQTCATSVIAVPTP